MGYRAKIQTRSRCGLIRPPHGVHLEFPFSRGVLFLWLILQKLFPLLNVRCSVRAYNTSLLVPGDDLAVVKCDDNKRNNPFEQNSCICRVFTEGRYGYTKVKEAKASLVNLTRARDKGDDDDDERWEMHSCECVFAACAIGLAACAVAVAVAVASERTESERASNATAPPPPMEKK